MFTITLTADEIAHATEIARNRNQMQREAGQRDGKVVDDSIDIDIQGACAELAISKALGLPWDGKLFKSYKEWIVWRAEGHDVSGLEVRSTRHPPGSGRLILHPSDKDRVPFVLVRAHAHPAYEIAGWIWAQDGKTQAHWEEKGYQRPAFYVPDEKLNPMETVEEARQERLRTKEQERRERERVRMLEDPANLLAAFNVAAAKQKAERACKRGYRG